jgi:hypothetical protein
MHNEWEFPRQRRDRPLGKLVSLTDPTVYATMTRNASPNFSKGGPMRARFLGKDPKSHVDQSPTLFATDRADRTTYIAQGWVVTDPRALADVGPIPEGEAIIEIPEDVLKFYLSNQPEGER